jgi:transposase
MSTTVFAGVDLGAKEHAYCLVDATGKRLRKGTVPNTQAGYAKLVAAICDKETGALPAIALESERGLFPVTLRRDGADVFFVSPLMTSGLRKAFGMGDDKSDSRDAEALAKGLAVTGDRIRRMRGVTDHIRALQAMTRAHSFAQERAEQATAVLRSHLADYWPAYVDQWDATDLRKNEWTRALVAEYPSAHELAAATDEDLRRVLKEAGRERALDRTISQIRPVAAGTVLHYSPFIEEHFGDVTTLLVEQVDAACETVDRLHEKVVDLYLAHPYSTFFDSLPGVGALTGARLLAEIGDDPFRFPKVQSLQAYGGCRPQTDASGKRRTIVRRRARNKFLEQAVTQWAGQIVISRRGKDGKNPPLSVGAAYLYEQQAGRESKSIYHGQRVVGQRLLGGLWHCLTYGARRPELGLPWHAWSDATVFARQYAELAKNGEPATPAVNNDPLTRDHRKGWTGPAWDPADLLVENPLPSFLVDPTPLQSPLTVAIAS